MRAEPDVIALASDLIRMDTRNPPGGEAACAKWIADRLAAIGLEVELEEYAPARANVIARVKGSGEASPIVLSGHIDVVPFGDSHWAHEPLGAEIVDGRLYGRGSADMKSGVAAMIVAVERVLAEGRPRRDIILALSGGEETGCEGAKHIASKADRWGSVGGMIVAEPTDNVVTLGHKGALWLAVHVSGKSAHGAFPERGVNAIVRAGRLIEQLNEIEFQGYLHETLLGRTSLNVGMIQGGMSINSVPDHTRFTVDIRTVHPDAVPVIEARISNLLDAGVSIETIADVLALPVAASGSWFDAVVACAAKVTKNSQTESSVAYFTDGGVLAQALDMPPTFILGPGSAVRAHTVDEYVAVSQVHDAAAIYENILLSCP